MSPENQADHEVAPAARFVETSRAVRLPTDGTGSSIMVAVLRRDLLPSTGNSKLPKSQPQCTRDQNRSQHPDALYPLYPHG
jgi:hypothetical protein